MTVKSTDHVGCMYCSKISSLSVKKQKSIHLFQEWQNYNVKTAGWTKAIQLASIRIKLPYFTDYKTHSFLRKIASKIQVRLILEINIKMSSVWIKIPASLKNGHIIDAAGNLSLSSNIGFIWRQQCSAQMRRIWVAGIHYLANTVSLPLRHHKPRAMSSP